MGSARLSVASHHANIIMNARQSIDEQHELVVATRR
jgi:hypothetical protein